MKIITYQKRGQNDCTRNGGLSLSDFRRNRLVCISIYQNIFIYSSLSAYTVLKFLKTTCTKFLLKIWNLLWKLQKILKNTAMAVEEFILK